MLVFMVLVQFWMTEAYLQRKLKAVHFEGTTFSTPPSILFTPRKLIFKAALLSIPISLDIIVENLMNDEDIHIFYVSSSDSQFHPIMFQPQILSPQGSVTVQLSFLPPIWRPRMHRDRRRLCPGSGETWFSSLLSDAQLHRTGRRDGEESSRETGVGIAEDHGSIAEKIFTRRKINSFLTLNHSAVRQEPFSAEKFWAVKRLFCVFFLVTN